MRIKKEICDKNRIREVLRFPDSIFKCLINNKIENKRLYWENEYMPKTMDNQSFEHNRYNYTYHIVFIPNIEKR